MRAAPERVPLERFCAMRELFLGSNVRSGVRTLHFWIAVPLLLGGCQSWNDAHLRTGWKELQQAQDEAAKVEAARELCQNDTSRFTRQLSEHLGAFVGSDAEAYVAVAIAKSRPNGFHWLSRRFNGGPLDEAFADVFDPDEDAVARVDWPALVDALTVCSPDSPEADHWLALMAMTSDGSSSQMVRDALSEEESPLRQRVRAALDRPDIPRVLTPELLTAFGAPWDDAETAWMKERFRRGFESAIEDRDVWNDEEFVALSEAWEQAFPGDDLPLPDDDRELARALSALGAADEPLDEVPTFREAASFMTRHNRTGWARLVEIYARDYSLPSNALSYACRASARECVEVLQGGSVNEIASAADVAPALDLDDGEIAMNLACGSLPEPEARQLSARGVGAGMPLRVREAAVACLMSLGDDVSAQWRELLPEAIGARRWEEAEMIAAVAPDAMPPDLRASLLDAVKRGELRAVDIPTILSADDEGAELVRQSILAIDPEAFDGIQAGAQRMALAPIAEHIRHPSPPSRTIHIEEMAFE